MLKREPPLFPYVEAMPHVMRLLKLRRPYDHNEQDLLHTHCGGVPHPSVREAWLSWLVSMPMDKFRGEPIWYRYVGDEPLKIRDALSLDGGPLKHDLRHGEVFRVKAWRYETDSRFERVERGIFTIERPEGGEVSTGDVTKREHPPWEEIRQMPFGKAKAFLASLGLHGRSWDGLAVEYEAFLLGES